MLTISADRVDLVLQSIEATLAKVAAFSPEVRAQISPVWLAMVTSVSEPSPWIHWFSIVDRSSQQELGSCGFKGPPDADGMVELAYGIENDFQGRGYATEAAQSLVSYALDQAEIRLVRAHTLPDNIASQRVLAKCGFHLVGEVQDPEDGLVLRWERRRN